MSNPLAIAAVTATLRNLLIAGFSADGFDDSVNVTTQSLDKARGTNTNLQVNLFLYQTQISAAWRNMDMPGQVKPGETGFAPLGLNLYYLLTAYGPDENDVSLLGHQLLGRAMSILHDNPILDAAQIEAALPLNDLHRQLERVRIIPQSLSVEDISKLWMTFQTQYRTSTVYEVSVVLIESKRPTRTPLPVLQRGRTDQGVDVTAAATPFLQEVRFVNLLPEERPANLLPEERFANRKPAAELGDRLMLVGEQLDGGDKLTVQLNHPLLKIPLLLTPLPERKATKLQVQLPSSTDMPEVAGGLLAGFFTLSLKVERLNLPAWTTNEISLKLAPRIVITDPKAAIDGAIPEAPNGDVSITLTCLPQVRPEQRVILLFGDLQVAAQPIAAATDATTPTTLTFVVPGAVPGTYTLRLRVDGVDSIPIDFDTRPPQFANNQKVKING
jgi:Pvc16 N-terminal domain